MNGTFSFPTRVEFGPGRVGELPEITRGWGRQPLIVTDEGILSSGAIQPVLDALNQSQLNYRIYSGVEPNPTEANVEEGLRRFQSGCDFVIGLGGGSAIDAAKAIRLRATHEGPLSRFDDLKGGSERVGEELPPMVAIPTTAGTGSEVGRSTVITIAGRKTVIFSPHLIPTIALCDPELTLGLPVRMTAGTGADALTHNLEAFLAKGFHPLCDAIALDGMRRAMKWLPAAVHHGRKLEARSEMMVAAMMGAIAFQKGLGVVHSLAHPLSSVAGVHHGTANAIMLPHALRFNREAIADRVEAAAEALGVKCASNPGETVEVVAQTLAKLFAEIGLPTRLREVNVSTALIGPMADLAMQDGCHLSNPKPVSREDMATLYQQAI
jgi:alcohol dehydrogenase class IV